MSISGFLKIVVLILVIIILTPWASKTVRTVFDNSIEQRARVGKIIIDSTITDTQDLTVSLHKLFKDESVKAIVLHIESSGGIPGPAQALFEEIRQLKRTHIKPVIAYSESVCTSVAYYIACAADYIICQPATLTGGIGISQELLKRYQNTCVYTHVSVDDTKSVPFDITSEQNSMLKNLTDSMSEQFVTHVIEQRPKLRQVDIKLWANNLLLTGQQAYEFGLVDELGSYSTLLKVLREKAAVSDAVEWVVHGKKSLTKALVDIL